MLYPLAVPVTPFAWDLGKLINDLYSYEIYKKHTRIIPYNSFGGGHTSNVTCEIDISQYFDTQ